MQFAETKKASSSEGGMQSLYRLWVKWICKARHCRDCKSIVVVQSGADFQSVQNKRDRKAWFPALPLRIAVRSEKAFLATFFALEKSSNRILCFGKQKRTCSFSKKKEKYVPFPCGKGTKRQKRKGGSPSLFNPNPFESKE